MNTPPALACLFGLAGGFLARGLDPAPAQDSTARFEEVRVQRLFVVTPDDEIVGRFECGFHGSSALGVGTTAEDGPQISLTAYTLEGVPEARIRLRSSSGDGFGGEVAGNVHVVSSSGWPHVALVRHREGEPTKTLYVGGDRPGSSAAIQFSEDGSERRWPEVN